MTVTRLRIGCLLLLVALFAPLANANSVPSTDPRIIINDPPNPACTSVTSITGTTFAFMADANGGGFLCFTNDTGTPWLNISITVPLPLNATFPDDFFCDSDTFATCTFSLSGNILTIFFTDGALPDDGTNFNIDLNSDNPTGWGPNASFTAVANVPEPGTLSLFLAGIGTLVARRRLRKGART